MPAGQQHDVKFVELHRLFLCKGLWLMSREYIHHHTYRLPGSQARLHSLLFQTTWRTGVSSLPTAVPQPEKAWFGKMRVFVGSLPAGPKCDEA